MEAALTRLIDRLDSPVLSMTDVIRWGSPVPSFGDLENSTVATLGLNPSNREFVDESGNELQGVSRRFPTLTSLGLASWSDVDARHMRAILQSCRTYFDGNPYDRWFRKLDQIVSGTTASYYHPANKACHLDLIPYATARRWTDLPTRQRTALLTIAADVLGLLLRDSPVRILILNGNTVVEQFQKLAGVVLDRQEMPAWSLLRRSTADVTGFAYRGVVGKFSGTELGRSILVLGFNHNLQSSFGVTTRVICAIRDWITEDASDAIQ